MVARQREGFGFQMWIVTLALRVWSNLTLTRVEVLKIRTLVAHEGFGFSDVDRDPNSTNLTMIRVEVLKIRPLVARQRR